MLESFCFSDAWIYGSVVLELALSIFKFRLSRFPTRFCCYWRTFFYILLLESDENPKNRKSMANFRLNFPNISAMTSAAEIAMVLLIAQN